MKKRLLFITLCLGLALPVPLLAQAPRDARLAITVADPSGAVIPNATVTIVDSADPSKTFKPAAWGQRPGGRADRRTVSAGLVAPCDESDEPRQLQRVQRPDDVADVPASRR